MSKFILKRQFQSTGGLTMWRGKAVYKLESKSYKTCPTQRATDQQNNNRKLSDKPMKASV